MDRLCWPKRSVFKTAWPTLCLTEHAEEVRARMRVTHLGRGLLAPVGDGLLGRVVDGLGRPLDNRGPLIGCDRQPVRRKNAAAAGTLRGFASRSSPGVAPSTLC